MQFIKEVKWKCRWKSLDVTSGLYSGRSIIPSHSIQSQVQLAVRGSVTSVTFDPLRTIWLSSDFDQMLIQRQPSPPCYWHLTQISSMPG